MRPDQVFLPYLSGAQSAIRQKYADHAARKYQNESQVFFFFLGVAVFVTRVFSVLAGCRHLAPKQPAVNAETDIGGLSIRWHAPLDGPPSETASAREWKNFGRPAA